MRPETRAKPVGHVRHARSAEAAALSERAFRSKAAWGYDAAFMAACREELSITPQQIVERPTFVCEVGDAIAGFYRLDHVGDIVDVALFFVAPEHMPRGIGTILWGHLIRQAQRLGADTVTIGSDPHAVGFYQRMGAHLAGGEPSASIAGRTLPRLVLALPLRGPEINK